ncbi:MAG: hypothetical protein IKD27_02605 [Oscillospiraceae bacterium]|nr:hypothetical protein [Oscillospiraceae bacterium]
MDSRLKDLYTIPHHVVEQDIYLLDLSEHCAVLEEKVRILAAALPMEQRSLIEAYLDIRDELEFQSVKIAMRFGKHLK